MSIFLSGVLIGLSLIVAIGPQNALIIKQGIKREHVVPVIGVCLLSDVILILGGTIGVGKLIDSAPEFLTALKWLGVVYLSWFAFTCFRDATHPATSTVVAEVAPEPASLSTSAVLTRTATRNKPTTTWHKPVLAALAFTWLNPAAYIDALIMLGGIANQHGDVMRWYFSAGALLASAIWFPTIGFLAIKGAGALQKPHIWRILNAVIGIIMVYMALRLALH
ncbi:LysE/ArgO family amino acid transporter [Corynebacterium sp. H127]|uniref:LysE/ArgO family amino acid transporter n=1 Tax=Corynebacterium sp. H127 TaxID=3133418 RepID=UPI0030979B5C